MLKEVNIVMIVEVKLVIEDIREILDKVTQRLESVGLKVEFANLISVEPREGIATPQLQRRGC